MNANIQLTKNFMPVTIGSSGTVTISPIDKNCSLMGTSQEKSIEEKVFLGNHGENNLVVKASKKRWLIIVMFIYYASVNAFQWIEYCSITPTVVRYYNVSTLSVDWTSIIYMALYPFLVVPASYIIDKKGLRVAGLIGCAGTLIGTSLKIFAIERDLFLIVMIGQVIVGASQLVIICLPPKLASVWFKPNEVSTICSLGVFGTQLGIALGYILPPIIVKDSPNLDEIENGLKIMYWALCISMIPIMLAVVFLFSKQPVYPPSMAQAIIRQAKSEFELTNFFGSIRYLFTNKGFVIHMLAFGFNIAVFSAIATLLTQFVLQFFEGAIEDAGRIGFLLLVSGMIGSVLFGIMLDRNHKYKETAILVYVLAAFSVAGLICALEWQSLIWTYITCSLFGVFTTAYMLVGFELAIELTFPLEESTASGILFSLSQIFGVIFTVLLGHLNKEFGCFWSLISQILVLVLGTIITAFVPNKLKRQEAFKNANTITDVRKESYRGSRLVFIE